MNEATHAKAPKILPWLAHKAGIDDRRALTLWQAALRHAAHAHAPETSDYWQAAQERLLELIAAESQRADQDSFGLRPWVRNATRAWEAPIALWEELTLPYIRSWRLWLHDHQPSC